MIAFRAAVLALSVAPLLLSPAHAQNATTISVSLTNFKFTPSTITLKSGTTYTLHLVNNGGSSHDFSAPEFFKASTVAAADESKIDSDDGGVDLDSGQSADVTVTPNKAGTYKLVCTHFMHQTFGMTGQIIVQ
ncbi:MAG: cupredoxin domain-containing protein [Rhizomicrobium sp.]